MGERLRDARAARGLSLRALADRLGVWPSLISQVERGLAKPSVNTLYSMASELEISLDELLFVDARPSRGHAPARSAPAMSPSIPYLPAAPVQRAGDRRTIRLASGVVWERLTT